MTVKLSPLGDRILVSILPFEQQGLIHLPNRRESAVDARVLAVGPEVRDIEPGMTVKVSPLAALAEVGDARLYAESSVLAVVAPAPPECSHPNVRRDGSTCLADYPNYCPDCKEGWG